MLFILISVYQVGKVDIQITNHWGYHHKLYVEIILVDLTRILRVQLRVNSVHPERHQLDTAKFLVSLIVVTYLEASILEHYVVVLGKLTCGSLGQIDSVTRGNILMQMEGNFVWQLTTMKYVLQVNTFRNMMYQDV